MYRRKLEMLKLNKLIVFFESFFGISLSYHNFLIRSATFLLGSPHLGKRIFCSELGGM